MLCGEGILISQITITHGIMGKLGWVRWGGGLLRRVGSGLPPVECISEGVGVGGTKVGMGVGWGGGHSRLFDGGYPLPNCRFFFILFF